MTDVPLRFRCGRRACARSHAAPRALSCRPDDGRRLLAMMVLLALLAPLLSPYDPYAQDLGRRLIPPIWYESGSVGPRARHRQSRPRLSLPPPLWRAHLAPDRALRDAALRPDRNRLGLMAGYFGGRVDMLITFIITVRLALPLILVALASVAVIGGSLVLVILVLGLLKWDRFAVVMRAATQQVRPLDYVTAAEAIGASTSRIMLGEVLPNVLPQLVVVATVEAASAILLEAALSFLGLGVQPPLPSWGR